MKELNLKHEAKRYGCAVLAATIMALNIKTFVRAGGLFPGGATGLTILIQRSARMFFQDLLCCSRTFFRHLWGLQFRIR